MVFSMKNFFIILLVVLHMLKGFELFAQQANNQFVFIGNNIGENSMTLTTIINVFKAKKTSWSNSAPVIIVLPSSKSPYAGEVSKYIYNTGFTSVQKFWLSEVFQGRSKPPVFFDSDEEIIQFIQKNEGAIGVIINDKQLNIPAKLIIKIENN